MYEFSGIALEADDLENGVERDLRVLSDLSFASA